MWNELGISGGTAIVILNCAVFRYQMGSEKWHQEAYSAITGKKTVEDIQNEKRAERTWIVIQKIK